MFLNLVQIVPLSFMGWINTVCCKVPTHFTIYPKFSNLSVDFHTIFNINGSLEHYFSFIFGIYCSTVICKYFNFLRGLFIDFLKVTTYRAPKKVLHAHKKLFLPSEIIHMRMGFFLCVLAHYNFYFLCASLHSLELTEICLLKMCLSLG